MLQACLRHLLLPAVATACLFAGRAHAQLTVELVGSGFSQPIALTAPPGDTERLFVVERAGRVRIIKNGSVLPTPFLDISGIVTTSFEGGLFALAFHPDYDQNGLFYVSYTRPNGDSVVREYDVSTNPDVADTSTPRAIVVVSQPFGNHNGGDLHFGPDGMLYLGLGDGGSGNDPLNAGQDPLQELGAMLRFDPSLPSPFIPADNPGVGDPGMLDSIWIQGLRNPWRWSFDRETGDLWIGDVGQNFGSGREEIDFAPADSMGLNAGRDLNFGWKCRHGSNCSNLSGCAGCANPAFVDPIHEYSTGSVGASITGGYVYRGSAIPSLQGTYFFADYTSAGRIFSFRYDGTTVTEFTERTSELDPPGSASIRSIASFGEDAAGELYILELSGGEIWKIVEPCPAPSSYCTATANSSGFPASISATGSNRIGNNDLGFQMTGLPLGPQHTGIVATSPDPDQVPLGNGNLCLGNQTLGFIIRLQPSFAADMFGSAFVPFDVTAPAFPAAQVDAGETWYYQAWYRDFVDAGFNLSNGVQITWCP